MKGIRLDHKKALGFISEHEIAYFAPQIEAAHRMLHEKNGPGNEYLGWMDLPVAYDKDEFCRIEKAAVKIRSDSDVLIVIGIGGSYLGTRAALDALGHTFSNNLPKERRNGPAIYFAGNNISPNYLADLFDLIEGLDVSVNVISKSGTTTEPAIAFRLFKAYLEGKYGKDGARSRIYATTDKARGALKTLSAAEGYETFVIPDDVGGRFSVLTAVGLLPIAAAGIDIGTMLQGAADSRTACAKPFDENDCYRYAAIRNVLLRKGRTTEIMVNYEPSLHFVNEWWKQLFGESEGKDQKGIFPAGVDFSTDLHSMGQYIQDGLRNLFETVLNVETSSKAMKLIASEEDLDKLNYLEGKDMDFVNKMAMQGTILAHNDGGVPNLVLNIPAMDAYWFGYLVYFFEKACAVSGYLLGVNPFDQPGVEEYKKNMFALLGKPGNETRKRELEKRL